MRTLLIFLLPLVSLGTIAQTTMYVGGTTVIVDTIVTGLDIPWEISYGPDNQIWTTERKGLVSRIDPVSKTKSLILDLTDSVYQSSESGLLGLALHPDFQNHPEVFLAYTYGSFNAIRERFVKYQFNGNTLENPVTLLENIVGNTTHIGARLHFLPDQTLLVSTGDAQNQAFPQDLNSLSGKILRMNTDGSIPADNPFPSSYIYSYGHRNVQGIVQAPNGLIYLSEHGATTDDEFQILEPGRNYGWPSVEGFCDLTGEQNFCAANNVKEPIVEWTPTIAPSDLVWYENSNFPELDRKLLMTVLKDKKLIALELSEDGTQLVSQNHYLTNMFGRLRDICVGPDLELYLATNGASWSNTNPNTHSIIRLIPVYPTTTLNQEIKPIKLYPNPAQDILKVELNQSWQGDRFYIRDMFGRILIEGDWNQLLKGISTFELAGGKYALEVRDGARMLGSTTFTK